MQSLTEDQVSFRIFQNEGNILKCILCVCRIGHGKRQSDLRRYGARKSFRFLLRDLFALFISICRHRHDLPHIVKRPRAHPKSARSAEIPFIYAIRTALCDILDLNEDRICLTCAYDHAHAIVGDVAQTVGIQFHRKGIDRILFCRFRACDHARIAFITRAVVSCHGIAIFRVSFQAFVRKTPLRRVFDQQAVTVDAVTGNADVIGRFRPGQLDSHAVLFCGKRHGRGRFFRIRDQRGFALRIDGFSFRSRFVFRDQSIRIRA